MCIWKTYNLVLNKTNTGPHVVFCEAMIITTGYTELGMSTSIL